MVVLDTDFIVAVLRNDPAARKKLEQYEEGNQPLCITSITVFELLRGVYRGDKQDIRRAELVAVIRSVFVIELSYLDADAAAQFDADLAKRGTPIGELDLLIAGICMMTKKTLITRNIKHFAKVKGLRVETW